MIAVVTGGSGFIGQNLIRRLLTEGHEVRCLVRASGGQTPAGVSRHVVRFDEPRSLVECAALEDAQVVFHLAGATKGVRADDFTAANVVPTKNLLGAIASRRLYPKFVYVSSQAAAGPARTKEQAIDEETAPHPVEPYGQSKLQAERIVKSFSARVAATIVRPCAVFGPHDRDFFALFRLAQYGIMLYPGTANHWLSALHVDDVVSGLLAAAKRETSICRTFFLSSSTPVQWRTVGECIADAVGKRARHVDLHPALVQAVAAAGDVLGRLTNRAPLANSSKAELARHPYWVCSSARAREELGFHDACSLPDAVRDTYYWYRQSGWLRGSHRAAPAVA
jgi:nucleoside-diphosphate-sugar epimerase